jgi:hypothetical protein
MEIPALFNENLSCNLQNKVSVIKCNQNKDQILWCKEVLSPNGKPRTVTVGEDYQANKAE